MKALLCRQFGDIDDLVIGEAEVAPLGDNGVHVAVHAASVNFMDQLMVQGRYQHKPDFPFVPGSDAAGEVIAVGKEVTHVKPGDRVSIGAYTGAFAEEMVADAGQVFALPDGIDYAIAAAARMAYGTGIYALDDRASLQPGEVLVVHGAAGGLGLAAVDLGRHMGARVIGSVGSDDKMDVVRGYGAEHVINYSRENVRDRVKELTDGRGADVIYDTVGGDVFDQSLRCINWGGRLLVIGFTSGRIPSAPANLPLLKNCAIVGVFYGAWIGRDPQGARRLNRTLFDWIAAGKLTPHISDTVTLDQAADGIKRLANRQARGKIVVKVR